MIALILVITTLALPFAAFVFSHMPAKAPVDPNKEAN